MKGKLKKKIVWVIILLMMSLILHAQAGRFIDNMRNTSNLSDEEIEWYLLNATRSELAVRLDINDDGIADGTGKNVHEFIARMHVIIICRKERIEQLKRKKALKESTQAIFESAII